MVGRVGGRGSDRSLGGCCLTFFQETQPLDASASHHTATGPGCGRKSLLVPCLPLGPQKPGQAPSSFQLSASPSQNIRPLWGSKCFIHPRLGPAPGRMMVSVQKIALACFLLLFLNSPTLSFFLLSSLNPSVYPFFPTPLAHHSPHPVPTRTSEFPGFLSPPSRLHLTWQWLGLAAAQEPVQGGLSYSTCCSQGKQELRPALLLLLFPVRCCVYLILPERNNVNEARVHGRGWVCPLICACALRPHR